MNNDIEQELMHHGIRPTAVRNLVWQEVRQRHNAFALIDIEAALPRMDQSSIFRSLRLFAEHHMLHEIDDGTGSQKYCVCHCHGEKHMSHLHFSCRNCGKTYCLEESSIPIVPLPHGFVLEEAEYLVKGLCPKCSNGASDLP